MDRPEISPPVPDREFPIELPGVPSDPATPPDILPPPESPTPMPGSREPEGDVPDLVPIREGSA